MGDFDGYIMKLYILIKNDVSIKNKNIMFIHLLHSQNENASIQPKKMSSAEESRPVSVWRPSFKVYDPSQS